MARELHVVLGASGGTGNALVQELVARGHRVRAVNRRGDADVPDGVERVPADVSTAEGATAAVAGAAVVYHAAQPAYTRWASEFPSMNDAVIDGTAAADAKLVFADNLYMYGPDGPAEGRKLNEDTPQRARDVKGRTRILLAERLLAAHEAGRLRVSIGRSSDYYGPGGTDSIMGDNVMPTIVAGRTVRWPGPLDVPHTWHYVPDIARALATLGVCAEADGRAWHLPAAEPLTARQLLDLAYRAAGQRPRIRRIPTPAIRAAALVVPVVRELRGIAYQLALPFVTDATRFEATFGPSRSTPHTRAIAETIAWYRTR